MFIDTKLNRMILIYDRSIIYLPKNVAIKINSLGDPIIDGFLVVSETYSDKTTILKDDPVMENDTNVVVEHQENDDVYKVKDE